MAVAGAQRRQLLGVGADRAAQVRELAEVLLESGRCSSYPGSRRPGTVRFYAERTYQPGK